MDTEDEYRAFIGDLDFLLHPAGLHQFARKHVFPRLQDELQLIETFLTPDTLLFVRHMGGFAARLAAERAGTPLGCVFTAPSQAESFPLSTAFEQHVLGEEFNEQRGIAGLPAIANWETWHAGPQRFFGCWPAWFAQPSARWPQPFTNLGFAYDDRVETGPLDANLRALLRERPVLITAGTGFWQHGRKFYAAATEACLAANMPALLICPHDEMLPRDPGKGIHWFGELLPLGSVLPQVSLVIHHGGAGTSAHAMRNGVPQVILAAGGDRPDNARRIEQLRIGVWLPLPRWQPGAIQEAIHGMLSSSETARACARIRQLMETDGLADGLQAIHEMCRGENTGKRVDIIDAPAAIAATG
jgi:UDP:flavonoid glycosyltransferase YjiC (YdhE family)